VQIQPRKSQQNPGHQNLFHKTLQMDWIIMEATENQIQKQYENA
jgi:hypothetical protein